MSQIGKKTPLASVELSQIDPSITKNRFDLCKYLSVRYILVLNTF